MNNKLLSKISGLSILAMTLLAFVIFPNFKLSIMSVIGIATIIILDVVIGIGLYMLFRKVSNGLPLAMGLARVVYAAVFVFALTKISNSDTFFHIWDRSMILFGLHLILLGILVYISSLTPKILGIFVILSGVSYMIDATALLMGTQLGTSMFTFWGEVVFGFWLVLKANTLDEDNFNKFIKES